MGQRNSSKVPFHFQDFLLLPELTATYLGLCLGCSWGVRDRLEMLLLAWVAFWCLPLKRANAFLSYYFIFINSRVPPYIFSMLCSLHMYCPLYQKWKTGLLVKEWVKNTEASSSVLGRNICSFLLNGIIELWRRADCLFSGWFHLLSNFSFISLQNTFYMRCTVFTVLGM